MAIDLELQKSLDALLERFDELAGRGSAVERIGAYRNFLAPLSAEEIFQAVEYLCGRSCYHAIEGLEGLHVGMHALSMERLSKTIENPQLQKLQLRLRRPLPIRTFRPQTPDEIPHPLAARLVHILGGQARERRFFDEADPTYTAAKSEVEDAWQRFYSDQFR